VITVMAIVVYAHAFQPSHAQTKPQQIGRGTITDAKWHPNGQSFAVSGSQGLWIYSNDFKVIAHPITDPIRAFYWSPNAESVAVTTGDGQLAVYGLRDGKKLFALPFNTIYDVGLKLSWDIDGTRIAGGIGDAPYVWDAKTGEILHTFAEGPQSFSGIAWSPDGATIAVAGESGLNLYNAKSYTVIRTVPNVYPFSIVSWSPDGHKISASNAIAPGSVPDANSLQIFDALAGNLLSTIQSKATQVLSWSPDSTTLATSPSHYSYGEGDSEINLWDVKTGKLLNAAWSQLPAHRHGIISLDWNPKDQRLLSAADDNTVRIWNQPRISEQSSRLPGHSGLIKTLAWSSDGSKLASAGEDRAVRVWDAATGKPLQTIQGHRGRVVAVAWNNDGTKIASGAADEMLIVWDAVTEKFVATQRGHVNELAATKDTFTSIDWDSVGRRLISGGYDGDVKVYYLDSLIIHSEPYKLEDFPPRLTNNVKWLARDQIAFAVNGDVVLWDTTTGQKIDELSCGEKQYTNSGDVSTDETRIVGIPGNAEGTICVWDFKTRALINSFTTWDKLDLPVDVFKWIAFRPGDDKTIALYTNAEGDKPGKVYLLDISDGTIKAEYDMPMLTSFAWKPDGTAFAVGRANGTIEIWGR
jgi:WD40 repeat protein